MPVVRLSNTCSRYMPTLRLPVTGCFVNTSGSVMKRPASSGQHCSTGSASRSTWSPVCTTSWQAPDFTTRGCSAARSLRRARALSLSQGAARHFHGDELGDPRGQVVVGGGAERPAHALVAAELVHQHRIGVARGLGEEQCRTAGLDHPVGDLGHLEHRVDRSVDDGQPATVTQQLDEVAKVLHWGEVTPPTRCGRPRGSLRPPASTRSASPAAARPRSGCGAGRDR